MAKFEAMAKCALVTGASHRLGRVIAENLAAEGWAVGIHYKDSAADADDLVREITAKGGRAVSLRADLRDEDETIALIRRLESQFGVVGALINNASTFEQDSAFDATRDSWDLHMDTNLRAPFILSQEFAKRLPKDQEGAIINLIDQRVWALPPYFFTYTLSKAALWSMTQTLALAFSPRIRVNGIGPGPTLPSCRQSEESFEAQWREVPLQRPTDPLEIFHAVRYILASRAMTGQMIALDGGQHLGWLNGDVTQAPQE